MSDPNPPPPERGLQNPNLLNQHPKQKQQPCTGFGFRVLGFGFRAKVLGLGFRAPEVHETCKPTANPRDRLVPRHAPPLITVLAGGGRFEGFPSLFSKGISEKFTLLSEFVRLGVLRHGRARH